MTPKQMRDRLELWQEVLPTKYPVKLVVTSKFLPGGAAADTYLAKQQGRRLYEIRIRKQLCGVARYVALIHEYAHCLTYEVSGSPLDHSPEWGLAVARLWSYESDTAPIF